jgi:CRP/FNR family nitrogen fixation transcriptional regulator
VFPLGTISEFSRPGLIVIAWSPIKNWSRSHVNADLLSSRRDPPISRAFESRVCARRGENEPADYVYKVVSGAVRTYKIFDDGRRQIGGFYFPGEAFGLEPGDEHEFSAEAIDNSVILVIKRSALVALADREPDMARKLWSFTARELQRVQKRMLLLVKSAEERVAYFLLEMAGRLQSAEAVDLPMSRQDIADYLGLTIETVSRTLTQLETKAAIALPKSRRVVLSLDVRLRHRR